MAIVTTYVCDVSGISGTDKKDFVEVKIQADNSNIPGLGYSQQIFLIQKLIHIDVARKLNLVYTNKEEAQPEVTFESKLNTLLKEYVTDIAYEIAEDVVQSYKNY